MARKSIWMTTLILSVFMVIGTLAFSQPKPNHRQDESKMQFGEEGPRHNRKRPDRKPKRPQMDPKAKAARDAMMTTAEAHRQLSKIFKKQGKIDESAAELKKIINLADCPAAKSLYKSGGRDPFARKVLPVYTQLAKMYIENDRLADAVKIINEGVARYETEQPQLASKLILTLGQIFTKKGESKKAEETYKRVIELNSKSLK